MAEESDSLSSLEERITRAVQLVRTLREQNGELQKKLESVSTERDAALTNLAKAKHADADAEKYKAELDQLKAERKHVRSRIEKLADIMDQLGKPDQLGKG